MFIASCLLYAILINTTGAFDLKEVNSALFLTFINIHIFFILCEGISYYASDVRLAYINSTEAGQKFDQVSPTVFHLLQMPESLIFLQLQNFLF